MNSTLEPPNTLVQRHKVYFDKFNKREINTNITQAFLDV
jgi:hypothetical protein